ncbi:MAG: tRNA (guanosine(37)-N1)-methyltransferase TrmD [Succiniclasticum sp.]|jgi:tRNA (guanine37-N1)-methyltransferase|nr:tRNA (guanosine(37)-N1)-methyltransferase TrmD [Succiniclasticum sp.]
MKFIFITLFPEQIEAAGRYSMIKRGLDAGLLELECVNPRDFSRDKHRSVDDTPFGGGVGMVLKPEPVVEAIRLARQKLPGAPVLAMSPGGVTFSQPLAEQWARCEGGLIFVCGHYEGFDERVYHYVDAKVSVGDYVLTGGELPALLIMDAVSRFVPGVLGKLASAEEDSFSSGLLEYPQYTRPVDFEGLVVPEVLRNGNHQLIAQWRRKESLRATLRRRPDLLPAQLSKADAKLLAEIRSEEKGTEAPVLPGEAGGTAGISREPALDTGEKLKK